ncbi:O-antigen ligase family protein [Paenibacillus methanolicus]|uniref:O-antigen ligase-like membrane protein n=1 Tax=Paenibacillus methanolicus TaxID=582686 RepID=A0A5S5BU61_9BACL|nr:O-antigen ligase family protein [Paenibacillus methanolicus]TYP69133.1 O-antigen ligase-like membrane protein [Paenibacillus methanolicus]
MMINAFKRDMTGVIFAVFTVIILLMPFGLSITGNNYIKLLQDAAYGFMILNAVYLIVRHKPSMVISPQIFMLFCFILMFTIIGLYFSGLVTVALQFRQYGFLFFLIIMMPYASISDFKYVWPILKAIAAGCIPVSIAQFLYFQTKGDYVSGLMGPRESGTLTLFLLIVFFSEFMLRLSQGRKLFGLYFLFLVPTTINETKISYVLIPLLLFSSLLFTKKLKMKYVLNIVLLLALLFAGTSTVYNSIGYNHSLTEAFEYENLKFYLTDDTYTEDAGRLTKILLAVDIIEDSPYIGYGLGSTYKASTSGAHGYIFQSYPGGNQLSATRPQLMVTLIDFGWIGTVFVLLMLITYFIKVLRLRKITLEKIVSLNCFIIIIFCFPYHNLFAMSQIMTIFIIFTVICLRFKGMSNHDGHSIGTT